MMHSAKVMQERLRYDWMLKHWWAPLVGAQVKKYCDDYAKWTRKRLAP